MSFTRADAESFLVSKLGGKLAFVRKSIVRDGANPDLAYPLANAMASLGLAVGNYSAISDDDLARIPTTSLRVFLGLAEYYALSDIWGSMTDVTETAVTRTQSWSLMSREILDRMAALEKLYATYLLGLKPLTPGTIRLPFVARGRGEF